jgi:hypothetical protein
MTPFRHEAFTDSNKRVSECVLPDTRSSLFAGVWVYWGTVFGARQCHWPCRKGIFIQNCHSLADIGYAANLGTWP